MKTHRKPVLSRSGSLAEYRRKRDFAVTPEPAAGAAAKPRRRGARARAPEARAFVVQKHAASHLHYDFRLEHDGVMLSWAIPRGPSLDPAVKRLAMQTEDHPIAYNQFEGVIPAGEYGGGTVMVWDQGTWEPLDADPGAAFARGEVKLALHGRKLRGAFVLVRTGGDGRRWLLIKKRDADATTKDPTIEQPFSAVTGRSLSAIARADGATAEQIARAQAADPEPGTPPDRVAVAKRASAKRASAKRAGVSAKRAGVSAKRAGVSTKRAMAAKKR